MPCPQNFAKNEKSCFKGDRFQVFFDLYMEGYIKTRID